MRMRRKKNLYPRLLRCAPVSVQNPESLRGNWLRERPQTELHVELGCGKGRFTVETAETAPHRLFVAVERVPEAMVIAMERTMERGLKNVMFLDLDAAQLEDVFAPCEVRRIYVNFCDPWPSPRHAKRRLTSPLFLARYQTVLMPGGEIYFKTDNVDLFAYSVEMFSRYDFSVEQVTKNLHAEGICGVMTDYEEKFHLAGVPICRAVARWDGGRI